MTEKINIGFLVCCPDRVFLYKNGGPILEGKYCGFISTHDDMYTQVALNDEVNLNLGVNTSFKWNRIGSLVMNDETVDVFVSSVSDLLVGSMTQCSNVELFKFSDITYSECVHGMDVVIPTIEMYAKLITQRKRYGR